MEHFKNWALLDKKECMLSIDLDEYSQFYTFKIGNFILKVIDNHFNSQCLGFVDAKSNYQFSKPIHCIIESDSLFINFISVKQESSVIKMSKIISRKKIENINITRGEAYPVEHTQIPTNFKYFDELLMF